MIRVLKIDRLKLHTFLNSLANNVASPFVGFDVTASGAANVLIGYVQAVSTLATAVAQLIGGRIADETGKRVAMTIIFSIITGVLWVGTAFLQTPILVAIAFTGITIAFGFYSAGWTAIVGEASEVASRGSFLSTFAVLTSVGGLIALALTTVTAVYASYWAFYLLSGFFFIVSGLVLRGRKEQAVEKKKISTQENLGLRKYYIVSAIYGLFWGFAWPLFTITLVKIVKMNLFQYSLAQMIAVGSTIAFQPLVGRLVDKDRKRGVFWGRIGLVIYPIVYILFTNALQVYLVEAVSGITNALLNVAFVAYLYDISPAGQRGRYTAELGLVTGVTTMIGSLTSAYILTILNMQYSLWLSLAYLYIIAAIGRTAAAFLHLKLPSNVQIVPVLKKPIRSGV